MWWVPLGRGCHGLEVLLVAGKWCVGCHLAGGAMGWRCCWSQARGVVGATGQGVPWAGGAAGRRQEVWWVPLGRGCHGLEVLLVAGKRCGGCHWAGGAMGWRCCWSQARGVVGATGQGVLLVAGKRCGGCHWAGGVTVCLHVAHATLPSSIHA